MFYGLDLPQLQSLFGSKDEALLQHILQAQADALADNDGFFEDQREDDEREDADEGDFPTSETVLREIIAGTPGKVAGSEAVYGYVLKILCEHLGEMLGGGEVAAIRDHPYKSQLLASGPPIPIPINPGDFPEIGYLALADIPAEIARIDAAPRRPKTSLLNWGLRLVSGGVIGREMNSEDLAEDMAAYRDTLQQALDKRVSVVSFRH
jgi:hypothetical protein